MNVYSLRMNGEITNHKPHKSQARILGLNSRNLSFLIASFETKSKQGRTVTETMGLNWMCS